MPQVQRFEGFFSWALYFCLKKKRVLPHSENVCQPPGVSQQLAEFKLSPPNITLHCSVPVEKKTTCWTPQKMQG